MVWLMEGDEGEDGGRLEESEDERMVDEVLGVAGEVDVVKEGGGGQIGVVWPLADCVEDVRGEVASERADEVCDREGGVLELGVEPLADALFDLLGSVAGKVGEGNICRPSGLVDGEDHGLDLEPSRDGSGAEGLDGDSEAVCRGDENGVESVFPGPFLLGLGDSASAPLADDGLDNVAQPHGVLPDGLAVRVPVRKELRDLWV